MIKLRETSEKITSMKAQKIKHDLNFLSLKKKTKQNKHKSWFLKKLMKFGSSFYNLRKKGVSALFEEI